MMKPKLLLLLPYLFNTGVAQQLVLAHKCQEEFNSIY